MASFDHAADVLAHEKLDTYHRSLGAVAEVEQIARAIPRAYGELQDQMRRAAISIALNLAEGAGEFSPGEKARFYRMARRSASEVCATLDLAVILAPGIEVERAKRKVVEVAEKIDKLVFVQRRRSG